VAFYSDKASVFRNNKKEAQGGDSHRQFGGALYVVGQPQDVRLF
jgi:hypothetical protein